MELSAGSIVLLAFGLFGSGLAIGIAAWQLLSGQRALQNFLLAIAYLAASWWITMGGLVYSGLAVQFPALFTSDIALIYFIGPCMYAAFHLRSGLWQPQWRQLLRHGIAPLAALLVVAPAMLGDSEFKRLVLNVTYSVKFPRDFLLLSAKGWSPESYAYFLVLVKVGAKISMMGYIALIVRKAPHLVIRPAGPRTVFTLRLYCSLGILGAFVSMMSHFTGLAGAGMAVLVGTIALVGLQILDGLFAVFHNHAYDGGSSRRKTSATGRTDRGVGHDADVILEQLRQIMENERLYCDEDLSLARLAAHLDIRADQLSYILNQHCNQNFYSYVNGHRVLHAKELLAGDDSIAFIAQAVGFNSQQVFTSVFGKLEGMTPTKYREKRKQPTP